MVIDFTVYVAFNVSFVIVLSLVVLLNRKEK
jgi:hypothetical protein